MDNEKNKNIEMSVAERELREAGSLRPWQKPTVTRIEMKRTMFFLGSGADSIASRLTS